MKKIGPISPASGIDVDVDANVLLVRIERQRLGLAALRALHEVFANLHAQPPEAAPRAVLLFSSFADFCHGADLTDGDLAKCMLSAAGRLEIATLGQELVVAILNSPVPTIVAASGKIVGAGGCLFAAADFRFVTPDAALSFPEVDRGMHLSWGIVPVLLQRFGPDLARRLALAVAPLPAQAFPPGAASVTTPESLVDDAKTFAKALAQKPPLAVRSVLKTIRECETSAAAADDSTLFAETVASADFAEAMAAFFAKRPGNYRGK